MTQTPRLLALSRMEAALKGASLLSDSDPGVRRDRCRAQKRIYIGQGRMGGTWAQCRKAPRPGKRTCHWHAHLED